MDNPQLGRKVIEHVTDNPEELYMSSWVSMNACKTTACLAGHAMFLSGYGLNRLVDEDGYASYAFSRPDGSAVKDNEAEAITLLGLTHQEYWESGRRLFFVTYGPLAIQYLRDIVEAEEKRRADRGEL